MFGVGVGVGWGVVCLWDWIDDLGSHCGVENCLCQGLCLI